MYKKSIIWLVILLFLLSSIIPFASSNEVSSNNIIYVDDDGGADYTRIQDAIDNASDGDTIFVYSGNYYENLVIDKAILLHGEDKNTTIIHGEDNMSSITITVPFVSISGFTIQNNSKEHRKGGISIVEDNILISNNIIKNTEGGIWLGFKQGGYPKNNIITNNIFINSTYGVSITFSTNNTITNNTFFTEYEGIRFIESNYNIVTNNNFFNAGMKILNSYNNNIINNFVNNKPLIYLENEYNKIINKTSGQIILNNCENITITDQYISNLSRNIYIHKTNNVRVFNCTIVDSRFCLRASYSSNVSLIDNKFRGNYCSISIAYSDNVTIFRNEITNNDFGYYGIGSTGTKKLVISYNKIMNNVGTNGIDVYAYSPNINNNTITNNNIGILISRLNNCSIENNFIYLNKNEGINFENGGYNSLYSNFIADNGAGIYFRNVDKTNIINNIISNNNKGIHIISSSFNSISYNTLSNNSENGIYLEKSSNNTISSNIFFVNKNNAYFSSCDNTWKRNYWDRPRLLPYLIFGKIASKLSIEVDWYPRLLPYNSPSGEV